LANHAVPVSDSKHRHYALAVLTLTYFFNFADRQVLSVLLEDIKLEFALSDTQLGLLSGLAFALFYSTLGIPIARLADRANRVKIIASAVAVWSLATAACGLATNFVQLMLARVAVGVGEAGCGPPSHAVLADYYEPDKLSRALGILAAAAPLGAVIGVLLGGFITQYYGWRLAFVVVGLPGLLVALLVYLTVREPKRGQLAQADVAVERPAFRETFRRLSTNSLFIFVAFGNACAVMMAYVSATWAPPLYRRVYEIGAAEVGVYAAIGVILGAFPGTLAGGWVSDRLIKRDPRWQCWMPALALMISFPILIVAPFSPSVLTATLVFAAGSFLNYMCLGPASALAQTVTHPGERAVAASLFIFLSSGLGIGVGPSLVGFISDSLAPVYGVDSLRYAMAVMSVSVLIAAALFLFAARALGRRPALV
jgi:predicted MFS family arabinose efflux permease